MENKKFLMVIGLIFVITLSGCIGGNGEETTPAQEEEATPTEDDVETYSSETEDSEIEVVANHDEEVFEFYAEFREYEAEEEEAIEFNADIMCGLMGTMAFEHEEFLELMSEWEEMDEAEINEELAEVAPEHVFLDYEVEKVEVELLNREEEVIASCEPEGIETLNIEIH